MSSYAVKVFRIKKRTGERAMVRVIGWTNDPETAQHLRWSWEQFYKRKPGQHAVEIFLGDVPIPANETKP